MSAWDELLAAEKPTRMGRTYRQAESPAVAELYPADPVTVRETPHLMGVPHGVSERSSSKKPLVR